MKRYLISIPLALAVAACGSNGTNNASSPSNSGASSTPAVPAPAGKKWSEVVSATDDGGYQMGNPGAPVSLDEYGSFTCSHCKDFAETSATERLAMVDSGALKFTYHPFIREPLDMTLALIADCAGTEPFFPLAEQIFANQAETLTKAQALGDAGYQALISKPLNERFFAIAQALDLVDFAKQRGLPEAQLKTCLADEARVKKLVAFVQADGKKWDITGTPTLIVNGQKVDQPTWEAAKAKLKEAGL